MEIKQGYIMKRIQQILPTLLIILLTSSLGWAQSFDANRMNRDIKIMENILGEMFKTYNSKLESSNATFAFPEFNRSGNIRGTYLPGFGIIFNVVSSSGILVYELSPASTSNSSSFYYSSEFSSEENSDVSEENVKIRITEFLKDYATSIGQLKPSESVMVIYGSKSKSDFNRIVYSSNKENLAKSEGKKLPVISGAIKKKDLDDYRSGKLNEDNFVKKIDMASSEDKEYLDLKVMSNIFETALRDQDDESFRLSGNVSYLLLDNFGAIFNLDASYRTNNRLFGTGSISGFTIRGSYVASQAQGKSSDKIEKEEAEYLTNIDNAYKKLKDNLKEYLVDYGRTISSVKSNQHILTTVNIRGRYKNIPERIDVQLKKSVLDQLDRGQISREKALEQVVVTEY
jgi:hypothetical protein